MGKVLLTNSQIKTAERAAEEINRYPGLIKNAVTTFEYVINDSKVSGWILDTQAGEETKKTLEKNNQALITLADTILELYQSTQQLIERSKANNAVDWFNPII